ncbi:unnamed protein product, partial [Candidula unifasciata]
LSDDAGELNFEKVKEGRAFKSDFKSSDAFVYDNKKDLFVWIGKNASKEEQHNALTYAHRFLQKTTHPLLPITVVTEGRENKYFRTAIAA